MMRQRAGRKWQRIKVSDAGGLNWSAAWDVALQRSGSSEARFDPDPGPQLDRLCKLAYHLSDEGRRPFPFGADKIGRSFGWDYPDAEAALRELVSLGIIRPANNGTATRRTDFVFVAQVAHVFRTRPTHPFRRPGPAELSNVRAARHH